MFQTQFQNLATRGAAVAFVIAALLLAFAGTAQARTEIIRWTHGGSVDAVTFRMYVSTTPGISGSTQIADLSMAEAGPNAEGEYFHSIEVADELTIYVTVTAVSNEDVESYRSNEKILGPPADLDRDDDGVNDNEDAFPDDPNEWADSDGDGVGNNADVFPNDPSEWADADGDGHGDNADYFDNDPTEWEDSDGDSYGNNSDAFPNDPNEWSDRDGDGYGDNSDAFPDDPARFQFDTVLSPYRVSAGATADHETSDGQIWTRDMGFWNTGVANAIDPDININGTSTGDEMYRSSRTDQDTGDEMVWSFPITNGAYRVVLHFSEHVHSSVGQRLFHVDIEGQRVLEDFDIYANANNRQHRVVVRNFTVQVTDELLEIEFFHVPNRSDPMVMGIEIVSLEALEGEVLTTPGKPFVIDVN
ncbi:MAG: hypothetical protein GY944_24375 [bacterium]|nr:hypothetical protein [bacterium]